MTVLGELFSNRDSASPSLTKLTTSLSSTEYELDEYIDWFEETHDGFLHLKVLRLRGMFPLWRSIAYHNLVDLRLASPSDARWTTIPELHFRIMLEASRGLRILYFTLDITDRQQDSESVTPVCLNHLEVVSISTYRGNYDVLLQPGHVLRMLAPGSRPLRLSICHAPSAGNVNDYEPSPKELIKFLQRSNVAKFCAKYSYLRFDQVMSFAPNLEDLGLDSCILRWQGTQMLQRGSPATSRLNSLILNQCSPSLEQLEVLVEQYRTNSLLLSGCYWDIENFQVRNPIGKVSDLLERYPGTKLIFQSSSPSVYWDLIEGL